MQDVPYIESIFNVRHYDNITTKTLFSSFIELLSQFDVKLLKRNLSLPIYDNLVYKQRNG